jgi:serine/threonine protein kinase
MAAIQRASTLPPEETPSPSSPQAPETAGPDAIHESLGEGGMGSVFRATQQQPLKRTVALKIIKRGIDSREILARFNQELQALAVLDHPNIAKVYDAGVTDDDRPFFAMEMADGVPITDYARQKNLPLSDRLALFIDTCHAIQHAHQKGIIHRDLKPSNILVVEQDGQSVIKIIDFGIAKALEQNALGSSVETTVGQVIGTPQYMSPEQVRGSQFVDTRSDIYALGAVLYELLTDTTPFTNQSFLYAQ